MEEKTMPSQRPNRSTKGQPKRSRKAAAEIGTKDKYRGELAKDRQRQRQHEADPPDRGGPQGRKDRDFQRKF
jgi:hypothetical protein